MDHPPGQNVPVVKRWSALVEIQLYQQKSPEKTAFLFFSKKNSMIDCSNVIVLWYCFKSAV